MDSFVKPLNAVVVGATGGLGRAFVELLSGPAIAARVLACGRPGMAVEHNGVRWCPLELEDEASIAKAAATAEACLGSLDMIVVATGLLHDGKAMQPEKTWRSLDGATLSRAFQVNAIGPALVAKHFLPRLARDRKAVFAALSARVGSTSDNRLGGWHAYRASKAALNMLIRTLAVELARRNPTALCVGLHPGTVDTALSQPFQGSVPKTQLLSPTRSAGHLLTVLDSLTPSDSGRVFAWDGRPIPF